MKKINRFIIILSFSEYLFLLTILIKPQSGFKIAFSMLDQDGNGWIDKTEFKVRGILNDYEALKFVFQARHKKFQVDKMYMYQEVMLTNK